VSSAAPARREAPRAGWLGLLALLAIAIGGPPAGAHPLAPALLELRAAADGTVEVLWKTSRLRPRGARLEPRLPDGCTATTPIRTGGDAQSVSQRWTMACGPRGLTGRTVGVDGLESAPIDVLVRIALADGRVVSEVLRADRPSLVVPERQSWSRVLWSYGRLGVEHILGGGDHLLFVLGLLLLVAGLRPLLATITAFTVGHSITLSLVTLDALHVPSGPAELLIAVSVLALAVELARDPAAPAARGPLALARRPFVMAGVFGLVHGMGFAGALAEVGLPQEEIPLALFAFNAGLELGQIAFVAAAGGMLAGAMALAPGARDVVVRICAYGIGTCAAYWCLERAARMVGPI